MCSSDLGPRGWLRWFWRQLTTMRVALQLLFLLAIAAVPGSIFPQRTTSIARVNQYLADNPDTGPWLDRLGFFDVYGSVWFSAIYLLLMASLVGCIIPRIAVHWKAMRSAPPVAPRNLTRLEHHSSFEVAESVESAAQRLLAPMADALRAERWRVVVADGDYVSAERGYLRETGNLIFHIAVVVILVAVGFGSAFGYRGQIIVREGTSASNVLAQYDSFTPGRLFSTDKLVDGPFPEHYEPMETPLGTNPLHPKVVNSPAVRIFKSDRERLGKHTEFPYVGTTYRLTEHFQFWTKSVRLNAIAQPEQFVEISEALAKEKGIVAGDWVKVSSKRGFIKAKAVVTKRMKPLTVNKQTVHQIGIPLHWGWETVAKKGYLTNILSAAVGDCNTQTPEYKAFLVNLEKA